MLLLKLSSNLIYSWVLFFFLDENKGSMFGHLELDYSSANPKDTALSSSNAFKSAPEEVQVESSASRKPPWKGSDATLKVSSEPQKSFTLNFNSDASDRDDSLPAVRSPPDGQNDEQSSASAHHSQYRGSNHQSASAYHPSYSNMNHQSLQFNPQTSTSSIANSSLSNPVWPLQPTSHFGPSQTLSSQSFSPSAAATVRREAIGASPTEEAPQCTAKLNQDSRTPEGANERCGSLSSDLPQNFSSLTISPEVVNISQIPAVREVLGGALDVVEISSSSSAIVHPSGFDLVNQAPRNNTSQNSSNPLPENIGQPCDVVNGLVDHSLPQLGNGDEKHQSIEENPSMVSIGDPPPINAANPPAVHGDNPQAMRVGNLQSVDVISSQPVNIVNHQHLDVINPEPVDPISPQPVDVVNSRPVDVVASTVGSQQSLDVIHGGCAAVPVYNEPDVIDILQPNEVVAEQINEHGAAPDLAQEVEGPDILIDEGNQENNPNEPRLLPDLMVGNNDDLIHHDPSIDFAEPAVVAENTLAGLNSNEPALVQESQSCHRVPEIVNIHQTCEAGRIARAVEGSINEELEAASGAENVAIGVDLVEESVPRSQNVPRDVQLSEAAAEEQNAMPAPIAFNPNIPINELDLEAELAELEEEQANLQGAYAVRNDEPKSQNDAETKSQLNPKVLSGNSSSNVQASESSPQPSSNQVDEAEINKTSSTASSEQQTAQSFGQPQAYSLSSDLSEPSPMMISSVPSIEAEVGDVPPAEDVSNSAVPATLSSSSEAVTEISPAPESSPAAEISDEGLNSDPGDEGALIESAVQRTPGKLILFFCHVHAIHLCVCVYCILLSIVLLIASY